MEKKLDYSTELEKVAQLAKTLKSLQPVPTFLRKRLPLIKLRIVTEVQEQFEAILQSILQEPDPNTAFYELCDLYVEALPEQKMEMRKRWDFKRKWQLPDQTTLACNIEGEAPSEERIRASLIYASFMNADDYRDVLMWLAPIYHSARLIGLDADLLFRETSNISSPVAASLMHNFINREPNLKSLSAWLLEEVVTGEGVRLIHR